MYYVMRTILLLFHVMIASASRSRHVDYSYRYMATPSSTIQYNEERFRFTVDKTLEKVRKILQENTIVSPQNNVVDHTYNEKFIMAESATNTAISSLYNTLNRLGLTDDKLRKIIELNDKGDGENKKKLPITLRFKAKETCRFVKKTQEDVRSSTSIRHEEEETNYKSTKKKVKTSTVVTKVTKYHWAFQLEYTLMVYVGNDPNEQDMQIILNKRPVNGQTTIVVVGSDKSPRPSVEEPQPIELDLTWFLRQQQMLTSKMEKEEEIMTSPQPPQSNFTIDRNDKSCRTPRRNNNIQDAIQFFNMALRWGALVNTYIGNIPPNKELSCDDANLVCPDLNSIHPGDIFIPILLLFKKQEEEEDTNSNNSASDDESNLSNASSLLSSDDIKLLLTEQCRCLDEKIENIKEIFSDGNDDKTTDILSSTEATIFLLSRHLLNLSESYIDSVDMIEKMLYKQLTNAIGKELLPSDFEEFFKTYNKKIFKEQYMPKPFTYAVRRPHHYPDGTIAIERSIETRKDVSDVIPSTHTNSSIEPIMTIRKKVDKPSIMHFPINAATNIDFIGDHYLHAWVLHDFNKMGIPTTSLPPWERRSDSINFVARARQFSSFLLLIGNISGPNTFEPKHGIILQNKDEILIPLLLEQMPTPKEFKDSIKSLSPEQKRFAIAFRNIQLESSVFGICVIQLKPQLEAVLGLPYDSLTKEIRLTQDLLSLFIDYQIPSDLLTYDGDEDASVPEKINRVKTHVSSVKDMIADAKAKELEETKMEAEYEKEKIGRSKDNNRRTLVEEEEDLIVMDDMPVAQQQQMRPKIFSSSGSSSERSASYTGSHLRNQRQHSIQQEPQEAVPLPITTPSSTKETDNESTPRKHHYNDGALSSDDTITTDSHGIDFTRIPKRLDSKFDELDTESALRPTKIQIGTKWTKKVQKSLLVSSLSSEKIKTLTLGSDEQKTETLKAYDLLDALSKSGALPISYAELHVVVASTHRFDNSFMATVIEDNINPIDKFVKSLLIVSSTIHNDIAPACLLIDNFVSVFAHHIPDLLINGTTSVGNDAIDATIDGIPHNKEED